MDDLSTIRSEALSAVEAGGRPGRARRRARGRPRQEGQRHRPDEDAGRARPRAAQGIRRAGQPAQGRDRGGARGAQVRRSAPRRSPPGSCSEKVDVTLPARPETRGTPASDRPGDGRARRRSSARWASPGPRVRTSRTTGTTSPPSTSRPTIRRGRCRTPSICRRAPTARRWCCAPTPRRCRRAPCSTRTCRRCWPTAGRCASSCRAAPSASTTTRPTRRCSTRSKAW